jgi:hypothetical protein
MLKHKKRIINGYSGHFPAPFEQLRAALSADFLGKGVRYVKAFAPLNVLFHLHSIHPVLINPMVAALGGKVLYSSPEHVVIPVALPEQQAELQRVTFLNARLSAEPKPGDIVSIKLTEAPKKAVLFIADDVWQQDELMFRWVDRDGIAQVKLIKLRGGVLIDQGQEAAYVQILRMPFQGAGEAFFVPHERVQQIQHDRLQDKAAEKRP